ncbi:cupin domain-containing protein [Nocardia cyriacigeorgica]|uniref:cupin domain-containing protein n=1 Tax=Nocardia cyriacigeorgica TaxID=135487 RepID=UPI0013D385D4|nr:cupin domain-containing protein [Nocardia cyriacigeorgica]NEW26204.1 cupin domain-containing protein [Nocardia cyriacigeorgica]
MSSSTAAAVVVPNATAETVALPHGGAFHLLADAIDTGGALGVNRLTLGTGADGAAPHYHARSSELFYVLDGSAEFYLDGRSENVAAGGLVIIPPGMPHAFGAAPGSTADLLIVLGPGTDRFEYFRRLGRIQHGQETFDSLIPEQERYDVHFVSGLDWRQR